LTTRAAGAIIYTYTKAMKGNNMKRAIFSVAMILPLAAGLAYAMSTALAMPDVHVSYETNQCVKVVNYADTNYTCENYPSKFNHVWVQ
jgi:bacteriorhodopsin